MEEWTARVERAVLGEAQGETYFRALARRLDDLAQRAFIARCADLERHMSNRLADLADELGLRRVLTDDERVTWTAYGERDAGLGWDAIAKGLAENTVPAIEEFGRMRADAPPEHLDVVSDLLLHEEALRGAGLLLQRGEHRAALATLDLAIAQITTR